MRVRQIWMHQEVELSLLIIIVLHTNLHKARMIKKPHEIKIMIRMRILKIKKWNSNNIDSNIVLNKSKEA